MALSDVDYLLIQKHTAGTLTPREFAIWSGRMQDQEFVSEWHRVQDESMAAISEAMSDSVEEPSDEPATLNDPEEMSSSEKWITIFNAAIIILLFIILLAFIAFLILPEAWIEESSFSSW